jgi:hypothetical protein
MSVESLKPEEYGAITFEELCRFISFIELGYKQEMFDRLLDLIELSIHREDENVQEFLQAAIVFIKKEMPSAQKNV